jgi:DNA-directed RNA polymerase subunit M/transcription elongation factor TFIIS
MKKKKDCKECGAPLKDWQVKEDYDLCLECYREKRKTSHELLKERAVEEKTEKVFDDEFEEEVTETEKEVDKGVEEIDDKDLGYGTGHLEDEVEGEEEE